MKRCNRYVMFLVIIFCLVIPFGVFAQTENKLSQSKIEQSEVEKDLDRPVVDQTEIIQVQNNNEELRIELEDEQLLLNDEVKREEVSVKRLQTSEEPILLRESYQMWIESLLLGTDLGNLRKQLGGTRNLLNSVQERTTARHHLEVKNTERLPFVRIDIYDHVNEDLQIKLVDLESNEHWTIKAFNENMFYIPEGNYEISFVNPALTTFSFRIRQVEFPFIGGVGILAPEHVYDQNILDNYLKSGGKIFVYSQDHLRNLGVELVSFDISSVEDISEFQVVGASTIDGLSQELGALYHLDLSALTGRYKNLTKALFNGEQYYLSAYLPIEEGAYIVVSPTLMSFEKEPLGNYLYSIGSNIFDSEVNLQTIKDHLIDQNATLVGVVVIFGFLLSYFIFESSLKELVLLIKTKGFWNFIQGQLSKLNTKLIKKDSKLLQLLRVLCLISFFILLLLLLIVRMYQKRSMPFGLVSSLDNLNLRLESIGITGVFTYLLILVIGAELIVMILLLPFIISRISQYSYYADIKKKVNTFSNKVRKIKVIVNLSKCLIITVAVVIMTSHFLRFFGVYPLSFDVQQEIQDKTSLIGDTHYISKASIFVKPKANYDISLIDVVADITSQNEVYMNIAGAGEQSILVYTPEFGMDFVGQTSSGIRVFTHKSLSGSQILDVTQDLRKFKSLGVDRSTLKGSYVETLGVKDYLTWNSLLKSPEDLTNERFSNEQKIYELGGLVGQFEFFTILEGKVSISFEYEILNQDANTSTLFAALVNDEGKIVSLEIADKYQIPVGTSLVGKLDIEKPDVPLGVYTVIVGYDPKAVILDERTSEHNKFVVLRSVSLSSDKLVFRPISQKWQLLDEKRMYILRNERVVISERSLQEGFNRNYVDQREYIETPRENLSLINISPTTGGLITSYYSLYSLDRESYFQPFYIGISEISKNNDIILSRGLSDLHEINMNTPLWITYFTWNDQKFILGDKIAVKIIKK